MKGREGRVGGEDRRGGREGGKGDGDSKDILLICALFLLLIINIIQHILSFLSSFSLSFPLFFPRPIHQFFPSILFPSFLLFLYSLVYYLTRLPTSLFSSPSPISSSPLHDRLWNESDRTDSRIFAYERERGYFASPIFSPFCSLLADILMFKLFPPLFASFVLYPCLSLNPNWHVWGRFLYATCLIQIAAACYCKVSTSISKSTCVNMNMSLSMSLSMSKCGSDISFNF